jgi:rhodanese-related sulfurtransferase
MRAGSLIPVSDEYTPTQVAELIAAGGVQLIDVRTHDEHAAGHIPGDRLIPLSDLAAEAGTIDSDRPVILYCLSGGRSTMATQALSAAGFDAHNMSGGFREWHGAGLAVEPADGFVLEH